MNPAGRILIAVALGALVLTACGDDSGDGEDSGDGPRIEDLRPDDHQEDGKGKAENAEAESVPDDDEPEDDDPGDDTHENDRSDGTHDDEPAASEESEPVSIGDGGRVELTCDLLTIGEVNRTTGFDVVDASDSNAGSQGYCTYRSDSEDVLQLHMLYDLEQDPASFVQPLREEVDAAEDLSGIGDVALYAENPAGTEGGAAALATAAETDGKSAALILTWYIEPDDNTRDALVQLARTALPRL